MVRFTSLLQGERATGDHGGQSQRGRCGEEMHSWGCQLEVSQCMGRAGDCLLITSAASAGICKKFKELGLDYKS